MKLTHRTIVLVGCGVGTTVLLITLLVTYNVQHIHTLDSVLDLVTIPPASSPTTQALESDTCDFPAYRRREQLSGPSPSLPRQYLAGCTRLVYNRVPKCASRTSFRVFRDLGPSNNFSVMFIDLPFNVTNKSKSIHLERMKAVRNQRFVVVSHHYFHNWTRSYFESVLLINIVREPSSWFLSVFNSHKYNMNLSIWWTNKSISKCIASDKCFNYWRSRFGAMSFLCGQSPTCFSNSHNALQISKKHIEKDYLTVGVIEQLQDFSALLEYLLPGMFSGLPEVFNQTQQAGQNRTKTVNEDPITEAAIEMLNTKMAIESELYVFAKQRFNQQLSIMQRNTSALMKSEITIPGV